MKNVYLILENIRSAENVGGLFRTADGLGVAKIYLVGYTPSPLDRFGRKRKDIQKAALGAEETVPYEVADSIEEVITTLKTDGIHIVSVEQDPRAVPLRDFKPNAPTALILGNEVDGVSKKALELSDHIVEIPMRGTKESFNVGVAGAIVLYHLTSR